MAGSYYNALLSINTQAGTSYTLTASDFTKDTTVRMTSSSANTVTIPVNSSVRLEIGSQIIITQQGTGQTTIVADTGVTINQTALKIANQYGFCTLYKVSTDNWDISGNLTA